MTTNVFLKLAKRERKTSRTFFTYCGIALAVGLLLALVPADRITHSASSAYADFSASVPQTNGDWLTLFCFMRR